MANQNSIPRRIDKELDEVLRKIATENDLNFRQASRELAKMTRMKLKGNKIKVVKEIRF